MSYGIVAYRVVLSKVEKCFSTTDPALRKDIMDKAKSSLEELNNNVDDDEVSYEEIMKDFLDGEINYPDEGFKYWNVIEILIEIFGESLINTEWYPADIDMLYEFGELKMFAINTPKEIPSPDDFPAVFVIENKNLESAYKNVPAKILDQAQAEQFKSWIEDALSKKEDLVLYYQ